jgi:DNA-binding NarL/FixJ family response regulator
MAEFPAPDAGVPSASGAEPIRVVLADDSVLFREGVARILSDNAFDVVGQAGDSAELLDEVGRARPDVVITDIRMPPTHTNEGLLAAQKIRAEHPRIGVLVLSQYVHTRHAVTLLTESPGRVGYLLKDRVADIADFVDSVRRIAHGGASIDPEIVAQLLRHRGGSGPLGALTERESEILGLMAEGHSNQAISDRLYLSSKTIETHVGSIFSKLGLPPATDGHRRVLAVLMYLRSA